MKKSTLYHSFVIASICVFGSLTSKAQFSFTNSNSLLPIASHSGCAVTVVDVNNDGLDDILKMDQSKNLILELQNQNGTFTHTDLGNIQGSNVWGMSAADVDHNGWKDVVTGSGNAKLVKLFSSGGVVTSTITTLPLNYFVQNITFGDFNNDGWADVAVCDDNDYMKIYQNDGTGNLNATTTLIHTEINPGMTVGSDPYDSGNYGSVWTDFDNDGDLDLYIAHCRQSAGSNTDQRRRDRLFVNDGSNNYTENAQAYGIEITDFKQTWTTSFGDMDNDGDLDIVMTNHGEASQILQNDGTGHFTDITAGSGFTVPFDAIESVVEDFDNDGFLDILVSGPGWVMYHNNGDGTYTQTPGVFAGTGLLSFGIGDLNHDGKIDVFASYGNVYNSPTSSDDVLYMNTTNNTNHFITFNLEGTTSNKGAIGAKVTIYGSWGKQIREVRAGESYGTSNSMQLHFGLGTNTVVDSARIDWPSHSAPTHFTNLAADQFVGAIEGTCTITGNFAPGPGPYIICSSQTALLNGSAGFSTYTWSNGALTPSVNVSAGNYSVLVTNAAGCSSISPSVTIQLNPDETPTIAASGPFNPCAGALTLTSSPALSYSWSGPNGFTATSQTINPTDPGNYTVTIQGACGSFTSPPQTVNVLVAPSPTVTGGSSSVPAALNLSAAGAGLISWYDMPTGGTLLTTGTSYTTPVINTTTTYYVDQATSYPGLNAHTGQTYHTGTSLYSASTTNGSVVFNVLSSCTLQSVKVYTDNTHYGTREIQLLNNALAVVHSLQVNITADSAVITLNWALAPGTAYQLTTLGSLNTTNFGATSPFFQRSSGAEVVYPYTINNVVSLTGSNQGGTRFYYFYDWTVQAEPTICTSPRVPVIAYIGGAGVSSLDNNNGIEVFPNPSNGEVNIKFENNLNSNAEVELTDITGRLVKTWTINKPTQGQNTKLDVTDINNGTYLLNIKSDSKKSVQKLILNK